MLTPLTAFKKNLQKATFKKFPKLANTIGAEQQIVERYLTSYTIKRNVTISANSSGTAQVLVPRDQINFFAGIGWKHQRDSTYTVLADGQQVYNGSGQIGSLIAPEIFSRPYRIQDGACVVSIKNDSAISRLYEFTFIVKSTGIVNVENDEGGIEPPFYDQNISRFANNMPNASMHITGVTTAVGGSLTPNTDYRYIIFEMVGNNRALPSAIANVQNDTTALLPRAWAFKILSVTITTTGVNLTTQIDWDLPTGASSSKVYIYTDRGLGGDFQFLATDDVVDGQNFQDNGSITPDSTYTIASSVYNLGTGSQYSWMVTELNPLIELGRDVKRLEITNSQATFKALVIINPTFDTFATTIDLTNDTDIKATVIPNWHVKFFNSELSAVSSQLFLSANGGSISLEPILNIEKVLILSTSASTSGEVQQNCAGVIY